jgi:molybdopterin-guanine dinucleotide biosynthesis protein A
MNNVFAQSTDSTCCAIILSGGMNSRMGGRNKAFLKVGRLTILDRLCGTLELFFQHILLVTRQPELYTGRPLKIVEDIYPARSSLTGIHAGLKQAPTDFAFVAPCDAPFIKPALIQTILDAIEPEYDLIVPICNDLYQPLCSVYAKRCLPLIEEQLDRGDYKITNLYKKVRLKAIAQRTLEKADPQLLSFFNVNTPEALRASEQLIQK